MFTRRPGSRHNRGRIACARRSSFDYGAVASGTLLADISADFVTQSGTVSAFADQSGNSHNFAQGTASLQPAYEATGWVDGTPSALFDGSNDYVSCATSLATDLIGGADTPFTVFFVAASLTLTAGVALFSIGRSSSDSPFFWFNLNTSNRLQLQKRADDNTIASPLTAINTWDTSAHVYEIVHSGTNGKLRIDGTGVIDAALDVNTLTVDRVAIGGILRTTFTFPSHQRFKRMLCYTGALSDGDATSVRDALATEHGL